VVTENHLFCEYVSSIPTSNTGRYPLVINRLILIFTNITAGLEFGATLHGKNLMIDKSLYGCKTSAARSHEHLSELLLRLGYKKTKLDPGSWMVDKYHIMNI
jgi:hypothetical protein